MAGTPSEISIVFSVAQWAIIICKMGEVFSALDSMS
jgi:hypothetical protein